jgi:hypothetical protein
MLNFSQGFRSFKEGFDWKLVRDYLLAVKEHAWETVWGATVVGIPFTIYTLYFAPSRLFLAWFCVWIVLVAGYYIWRADHIRLIPKFAVTELIVQPTETEDPNSMNLYVQIIPECLTDAPVHECRGRLLRVCKRHSDSGEWVVTGMNAPLFLGWDYYGIIPFTLEPGIKRRLNICWWGDRSMFIVPAVDPIPSKFKAVFNSSGTFKFDIRLTAKDCSPVDVSVTVNIDERLWDRPVVSLIQGSGRGN